MPHHLDYPGLLRRHGRGAVEAAGAAGPEPRLRACPGWTVADLVWHLCEVHAFWAEVVERGLADPTGIEDPVRPERFEDLLAEASRAVERLADVLASAEAEATIWTWSPQKDVAFAMRRQALETAVHRWDVEDVAGRPFLVDPPLAADGVDGLLAFVSLPDPGPPGRVLIRAIDTQDVWRVWEREGGGLQVVRGEGDAEAAFAAPASDLLLALAHRVDPPKGAVAGDERLVASLLLEAVEPPQPAEVSRGCLAPPV